MSIDENFEEDFSDDPVLVAIDKKIRKIFKLIQQNTGYSMTFYVAKNSEDGIRTYSGAIGNVGDIMAAMQNDFEQSVERGETHLYEAMLDMLLEAAGEEITPEDNNLSRNKMLH